MGLSNNRIAGIKSARVVNAPRAQSAASSLTADIHTQLASLHQQQADLLRQHQLADRE